MNTTAIIIAIKNRSLTKTQRKSLYAWCKYMIEESYGTSESLEWFNIYCALNKRTIDWFDHREIATKSRKDLIQKSIKYLYSNKPNIP